MKKIVLSSLILFSPIVALPIKVSASLKEEQAKTNFYDGFWEQCADSSPESQDVHEWLGAKVALKIQQENKGIANRLRITSNTDTEETPPDHKKVVRAIEQYLSSVNFPKNEEAFCTELSNKVISVLSRWS